MDNKDKSSHYFSEEQTSPLKLKKIKARLRGVVFEFFTGSGVFSPKKIDRGTELLINKCIVESGWHVLDLGCGYGPVGITLGKVFPKIKIFMTDINQRAVMLAKKNAKMHNLNADIRQGDIYESFKDEKFDTILLNPPQTAGKKICFAMIEQAKDHLKKGGILQLVARHRKGGKSLGGKMKDVFGNVKDIAKKGGFRIYVSSK